MSDKSVLEQVLEHLLAEDDAQAKDLLHSFMVEKSREIYEDLLDKDALEEAIDNEVVEEESESEEAVEEAEESDEEAVEEAEESEEEAVEETVAGSPSEDFYDEVEADVIADESGVNEEEDEMEIEPELDGEESEDEGEEEVEDRVDDLEAQLDELKAEFEKLMSDEDGEEADDAEAELEDEMEMESFEEEIDLDEEVDEELEEATNFSKNQTAKNDSSADHDASPKFPKKESFGTSEKELFGSDGGEGSKAGGAKDNPASDNIGEEPKAHPAPKVSADKSESPIAGKVK